MDIVFTSFPMGPCQNIGHQRPGVPKQNVQAEERHNTGLNLRRAMMSEQTLIMAEE